MQNRFVRWGVVCVYLFLGRGAAFAAPECVLRYDHPARVDLYPLFGMPLGNGSMGMMFSGGPEGDVLLLNHDRLRPVAYREDGNEAPDRLDELRASFLAGRLEESQALFREMLEAAGAERRLNVYHEAGRILIETNASEEVAGYERMLDLRSGVGRFSYERGNVQYERTYFVSAPDNLAVMRWQASEAEALSCRVALQRLPVNGCTLSASATPGHLSLDGAYDSGMRFGIRCALCVDDGTVTVEDARYDGPGRKDEALVAVHIQNARALELRMRVMVNGRGGTLEKPPVQSFETLLERHSANHRALMERVHLRLGNASRDDGKTTDALLAAARDDDLSPRLVETVFQMGRYVLVASSRPGSLPANLQGLWSHGYSPAWQCRYQTDMNVQMCYWPANMTGLHECHTPLFAFLDAQVPTARAFARDLYRCDGILLPVGIDGTNVRYPSNCECSSIAGWLAQHYWEHYAFTQDETFLRKQAYPFMKEVAAFYEDFLFRDGNGQPAILPSASPENQPKNYPGRLSLNATIEIAIARELLDNLLQASILLGLDAERRPQWQQLADTLPGLPVEDGLLQEWADPNAEENQDHRHFSHLYPLFPGAAITPETTPELLDAAVNAIREREAQFGTDAVGWSYAWLALLYARAGEGDEAFRCLSTLIKGFYTADNLLSTLSDRSGLGLGRTKHGDLIQVEAGMGATAAIAEMVLQSHGGVIRILPALPEAWPEGKIQGLCARGAFEVDIAWQDGRARRVRIHSHAGKPCRVLMSDRLPESPLVTCEGEGLVSVSTDAGTLEFPTQRGKVYVVESSVPGAGAALSETTPQGWRMTAGDGGPH